MPPKKVKMGRKVAEQQPSNTILDQQASSQSISDQQSPSLPISDQPFREVEKVNESAQKAKQEYHFNKNWLKPESKD